MSLRPRIAANCAAFFLALGGAHGVHAVTASAQATLADPSAVDEQQLAGPGFDEQAFASAQAGYGFAKVVARATTTWDIQPGDFAGSRGSTATATSSFVDELTIHGSPGQAGTVGVLWFDTLLTFRLQTEQQVRGAPVGNVMTGSVGVTWDLRAPAATFVSGACHFAEGAVSPAGVSCDGFTLAGGAGGDYSARLRGGATFVFGQPFTLGLLVTGLAQAGVSLQSIGSGGTAQSWLDAGQSVYWDGIAGVTTLEGVAVDYTVSALSGADYSVSFAPIPEPATALLMLPALALLLPLAARRRSAA